MFPGSFNLPEGCFRIPLSVRSRTQRASRASCSVSAPGPMRPGLVPKVVTIVDLGACVVQPRPFERRPTVDDQAACSRFASAFCPGVQPGRKALCALASSQALSSTVVRGRSEPRGSTKGPSRPGFVLSRRPRKQYRGCGWVSGYAFGVTRRGSIWLVTTIRSQSDNAFVKKGLTRVDQASTGEISSDDADGKGFSPAEDTFLPDT